MWDSVPWFVGGGAEHSPEITRLVAYVATRGAEGIVGNSDCKVTALSTPGAGFNVAPGALVLLNRSAGGTQQSYLARMASTETTNALTPTGAGSGRSDLVVARIEDPQYAPWQAPADRRVGPYVRTFVIEGVPAGTTSAKQLGLGYPAVALARLDIPANTGILQAGNIVDLRKMANARNSRQVEPALPGTTRNTGATGTWVQACPLGAIVDVPEWATTCTIVVTVSGLNIVTAAVLGELRATILGGSTQSVTVDENSPASRTTYQVVGNIDVPMASRGTTVAASLDFRRTGGTGTLRTDTSTSVSFDITFKEAAV